MGGFGSVQKTERKGCLPHLPWTAEKDHFFLKIRHKDGKQATLHPDGLGNVKIRVKTKKSMFKFESD